MTAHASNQRERIVDLAFAKFNRFGIRRVTTDEIARDLRMSKKTLYQHFAQKEDLVRACTQRVANTLIPAVMGELAADKPVDQRLIGAFRKLAMIPRLITREFIQDIQIEYPQVFEEIDRERRKIFLLYEDLLRKGIEEGVIRTTVAPRVYVAIMMAVMDRVMVPEAFLKGDFTPREAVRTLITIMSHGLFVQDPDLDIEELVP